MNATITAQETPPTSIKRNWLKLRAIVAKRVARSIGRKLSADEWQDVALTLVKRAQHTVETNLLVWRTAGDVAELLREREARQEREHEAIVTWGLLKRYSDRSAHPE